MMLRTLQKCIARDKFLYKDAVLQSLHLMAVRQGQGGTWYCLALTFSGRTQLYTVHEKGVRWLADHSLKHWSRYLSHYGLSQFNWKPAEQVLTDTVLQQIKEQR